MGEQPEGHVQPRGQSGKPLLVVQGHALLLGAKRHQAIQGAAVEKMKTQMEALIYHFKTVTEGFRVPPGEVYQAVESPRGEMGYYVVSDGTARPYRVKVRSPSFANLQALPKLAEGRLLSDLVACIGTIDIVLGEIDR